MEVLERADRLDELSRYGAERLAARGLSADEIPELVKQVLTFARGHDGEKKMLQLRHLIKEMERRFLLFSKMKVRNIKSYHALHAQEPIPYLVLVIDELADLMATRGKEIEGMIVRLAQMARAVGIHLVLATQRPSVEVITGLIKANITSRVALQVASQIDSRTILDNAGAEKLLGLGDMLFLSAEFGKPKRIQGAYISDKEVKRVVSWIAKENQDVAPEEIEEDELAQSVQNGFELSEFEGDDDPLYEEAKRIVIDYQKASASLLQRRLRVGYARAARLLDLLEQQKVIGPGEGAKAREVYLGREKDPLEFAEEGKEDSRWFSP